MDWNRRVERVGVLTGAGISTDSGIPDYRGPDGVWTSDPEAVGAFTLDRFTSSADARARLWSSYAGHPVWRAEPNAAHRALARLSRSGVATRVLTQNVDGLHQRAGVPAGKVLELHGSLRGTTCTGCGAATPTEEVLARGEADPACPTCGGVLKPDVVLFGQHLDPHVLGQAQVIAGASEVFLAVGTSLTVDPAASLCAIAVRAGADLVVVNRDPTPYDDLAAEVVREPIGTALDRICDALAGHQAAAPAKDVAAGR
ncbi:Sir2 family NAD-dependent protein deacetylase [Actinosynnema sp. NPDC050436]|uniref:SIR2 family NAD-dependent protein deacylase n=1 Tax=Actinosynnema sp. NPDC050436 TaxID=3155659 RepID=UPI0033C9C62E